MMQSYIRYGRATHLSCEKSPVDLNVFNKTTKWTLALKCKCRIVNHYQSKKAMGPQAFYEHTTNQHTNHVQIEQTINRSGAVNTPSERERHRRCAKITCCWPSINQHFKTNTQIQCDYDFIITDANESTATKTTKSRIGNIVHCIFHRSHFDLISFRLFCRSDFVIHLFFFCSMHFVMVSCGHVCIFFDFEFSVFTSFSRIELSEKKSLMRNVMKTCQNQFSFNTTRITEIWMKMCWQIKHSAKLQEARQNNNTNSPSLRRTEQFFCFIPFKCEKNDRLNAEKISVIKSLRSFNSC